MYNRFERKKIIIISYYFPPYNNIASKRWAEMIPELEKNFDIYVFTQGSEGDLNVPLNESKIKRVGFIKNLNFSNTIYRRGRKHKLVSFFTEKMRTVDSTILSWYWKHQKEFDRFSEEVNPDIVITTINPFSTAFFGLRLKRRCQYVKWIVDIRDSVSLYNLQKKNRLQRLIDVSIDKYVVRQSDLLFTVSNTLKDILSGFYGKKVATIYNGFMHYNDDCLKEKNKRTEIQLYYAGKIYLHQEEAFFMLVRAIRGLQGVSFTIRLLGDSLQVDRYCQLFLEWGVNNVEIKQPIDNKIIIKEECEADILVLLEDLSKANHISKGTLTGKLFEYLAGQNPILAICRDDSEIGDILVPTKKGKICTTEKEILNFIKDINIYYHSERTLIREYSRESQALKVNDHINNILK